LSYNCDCFGKIIMKKWQMTAMALLVGSASWALISHAAPGRDPNRVKVIFAGGHNTDNRDGGRPVVLIAGALGVPAEVFREAFSHVRPAPAGQEPDPEQVHRNKDELMKALEPYGVTNERLDEVSNYYRYNRGRGEMWPIQEPAAYAKLKDGKVTGFEIEKGGAGFSSAPTFTVPGMTGVSGKAELAYGKDFDKNGSISRMTLQER
jgi:hypothetical protein